MIKCVVWDLDRTLVDGVLLESESLKVREGIAATLRLLHERGIVNGIASRNPPEPGAAAVAGLGLAVPFVSQQFGWGAKSESIRRIAEELHIGLDAVAFVDDDPYERAEVSTALPDVLALSPADIGGALDWPDFSPESVTPEARHRAASYARARERERSTRNLTGDHEQLQRYCRTEIVIREANDSDVARLGELSRRTSRFNSRAMALPETQFTADLAADDHTVVCVELRDRFSDDGTVGGLVVRRGLTWEAELVMMSCRAMGRGVIEALLSWLTAAAHRAGATRLRLPLRVNERNLPLRLALVAAGFRAADAAGGEAVFELDVPDTEPAPPAWVKVEMPT